MTSASCDNLYVNKQAIDTKNDSDENALWIIWGVAYKIYSAGVGLWRTVRRVVTTSSEAAFDHTVLHDSTEQFVELSRAGLCNQFAFEYATASFFTSYMYVLTHHRFDTLSGQRRSRWSLLLVTQPSTDALSSPMKAVSL